jgi:hypothetical protein
MVKQRSTDTLNILLGFAYLGGMTQDHIRRLWQMPERSVQRFLARYLENKGIVGEDDGDASPVPLLDKTPWYVPDENEVLKRRAFVYHLTQAGHAFLKKQDQYPRKPAIFRSALLDHDMRTVETIVRLIELARPADLSSINVEMELRLDPKKARPRADALVIIQTEGGFDREDAVPWTKDPAVADERRWRFAIESDNNTEPRNTIRVKGETYQAMQRDPVWRKGWESVHGPLPLVLWVVPHAKRLAVIEREWREVYPNGDWCITTDVGMTTNTLSREKNGQMESVVLTFHPSPAARKPMVIPPQVHAGMLTEAEQRTRAQHQAEEAAQRALKQAEQAERQARQQAEQLAKAAAERERKAEVQQRRAENAGLATQVRELVRQRAIMYDIDDRASYLVEGTAETRETVALLPPDDPAGEPPEHRFVRTVGAETVAQIVAAAKVWRVLANERSLQEWGVAMREGRRTRHAEEEARAKVARKAWWRRIFIVGTAILWGPIWLLWKVLKGIMWLWEQDTYVNPFLALAIVAAFVVALVFGLPAIVSNGWDAIVGLVSSPAPVVTTCGLYTQTEPIPLRSAPGLTSQPVIARMAREERLTSLCDTQEVQETDAGGAHDIIWLKVQLADGRVGWVNQMYVQPTS